MKYNIKLESEKGVKEGQMREHIERAAERARIVSQQRGEGDKGHEAFKKQMVQHAEMDKKKGRM